MFNQPLNILEFIQHPELVNDQTLSIAQQTFLNVTYGLPLTSEEFEIYQRSTGRPEYVPAEQNEATLIAGRRGGKTSKIAARVAVYEAFRNHCLNRGDRAYVMLIAPTKHQAAIAMRYVRADLQSSALLRQHIKQLRRGEIDLTNGVTIACYPCSHIAVRGVSIVCCICDELAFWRHEETAASPEEEVLAALRPAMATFKNSKLIKVSTPYRKEGTLWRELQQRAELDHLVWQLSSWEMNPSLPPSLLEQARKNNVEQFRREYQAEFTDQINAWVGPDVLDACIVRGRTELPRVENAKYVVAIDPAFQHSDFALAVLHLTADGTVVVDGVESWMGTKKTPLGFEWVCQEIARIVMRYGVRDVTGDQYCAPVIRQYFDKLGIRYHEFTFGAHTRADLFGNLRHLLIQRKLELLDNRTLLRQLRQLEEVKGTNGQTDIRSGHNQKDDVAVAVALAAFELAKRPSPRQPWVEVISVPRRYQGSLGSRERGWIPISD